MLRYEFCPISPSILPITRTCARNNNISLSRSCYSRFSFSIRSHAQSMRFSVTLVPHGLPAWGRILLCNFIPPLNHTWRQTNYFNVWKLMDILKEPHITTNSAHTLKITLLHSRNYWSFPILLFLDFHGTGGSHITCVWLLSDRMNIQQIWT